MQFVMMMLSGHNVAVALVAAATIVGILAGMVTGIFHVVSLGIPGILAGILSQLGLYSVNMRILGKSNQAITVDKYNLILSLRDIHGAIRPRLYYHRADVWSALAEWVAFRATAQ